LLDSNALHRFVAEPERLKDAVLASIIDTAGEVYYSAVSLWELAVKRA
jgi:PIN domain nuclease of toxin-antitoxin system